MYILRHEACSYAMAGFSCCAVRSALAGKETLTFQAQKPRAAFGPGSGLRLFGSGRSGKGQSVVEERCMRLRAVVKASGEVKESMRRVMVGYMPPRIWRSMRLLRGRVPGLSSA